MSVILRGARVFDGEGFGEPSDIGIADGTLVAASDLDASSAEIADAAGGYLLPGFIDCHVHLAGPHTQQKLAAAGVTTGLDMSSPPPLVQAMRGRTGVADIRSGMLALSSPESAHAKRMASVPGASETHVPSAADAEAAVARRVEQGADYIKVVIDLPGFDQETANALVAAAHAKGMRTIAHASHSDAVAMAERAGFDVLTHVPLNSPVDDATARRLAANGAVLVPTLVMMKGIVESFAAAGQPGPPYRAAPASVAAAKAAGVPVLVGTDANETAAAPASPPFGESFHEELELLVKAGLTPVEALRGATVLAAEHFGLDDRGRIEPGLRADLVLLGGDPTVHVSATRDIRGVWIAGERVVPEL